MQPRLTPQLRALGAALVGGATLSAVALPCPAPLLDALHLVHLALVAYACASVIRARSLADVRALPGALVAASALRLALDVAFARQCVDGGEASWLATNLGALVSGASASAALAALCLLAVAHIVVVARGAERSAEVSARFALDAMPGRQLAIDGDLRAGAMDADAARRARHEALEESRFAGAMDGALRFVKGDAVAGVIALATHLLAGAGSRFARHEGSGLECLSRAAELAIGQASLTRVAAFAVAVAAAAVVTRASWEKGAPPRSAFTLEAPTIERAEQLATVARTALSALGVDAPVEARAASEGFALRLRGATVARFSRGEDLAEQVRGATLAQAWRSLGLEETRAMLDALSSESPAVARALAQADPALISEVLQGLARDRIALTPTRDVFEAIARVHATERDARRIIERVRGALRLHRTQQLAPDGSLSAFLVDPVVEDALLDHAARHPGKAPTGELALDLVSSVRAAGAERARVLTSAAARWYFQAAVRDELPELEALSRDELEPSVSIVTRGTIAPV